MMNLYSTSNKNHISDFKTAVLQGLAPDGGLYMPVQLPLFPIMFWDEMETISIVEKANRVLGILWREVFSSEQVSRIVEHAFNFKVPVTELQDHLHVLELYHGPTMAFKDFGARTMASMLSVIASELGDIIRIVTATSGDTGAAVADGFHRAPGVEVYVLYPSGQVSPLQEKQFTTLGDNICALEVEGTFDDCQRLVKACFSDEKWASAMNLTTANSINISRLLPQMIYYIQGVLELRKKYGRDIPVICSVPSGNFGNLTAGLLAHRIGLPIERFVAATNRNHVVPDYLRLGIFEPRPSVRTVSNAMDVGNPSNFDRMLDLYQGNHLEMKRQLTGAWYDDHQTGQAIVEVWEKHCFLMDPHTAVGYLGCREKKLNNELGLVLATAHPAKFPETIEKLVPGVLVTPDRLTKLAGKTKQSTRIPAEIKAVKNALKFHQTTR